MELMIEKVSKSYRGKADALQGISLTVGRGILGLLGPNGAGKSSLMRTIVTLQRPTSGRILWNGNDVFRKPELLKSELGYLPQEFGLYPNLNAREFLAYMAACKRLEPKIAGRRIEHLLDLVNIDDARTRPLGSLSGGMKQRVGIAQALLNHPKLLIVDEPTVGLDPEERVRFRNLLTELSGERVVILSTHIVSDVESTATSIAVLAAGQLRACSSADDLTAFARGKVWELQVDAAQLTSYQDRFIVTKSQRFGNEATLRVVADSRPTSSASPVAPTLEDAYLALVSQPRGLVG